MKEDHLAVDLHQLVAQEGVDLRAATEGLLALYREVDQRIEATCAELALPCQAGCSQCCYESVFLTPLEFLAVWDWAQRCLSPETLAGVVRRSQEAFAAHSTRIAALERPPPAGERDHFEIARHIRFRCPLLGDDERCLVYPVRELFARLFGCSFDDEGGIYGCDRVAAQLVGREVTLLDCRGTARRLHALPMTQGRQVYPYYFNWLYGGG